MEITQTPDTVVVDLEVILQHGTAKLSHLADYEARALGAAGHGNVVVLTGRAPVWLYLKVAHALHGVARRLVYRAPALRDAEVVVFDHDAF